MIKDFTDSRHQPLTWKQHLENEKQEERHRQEEAERPIREAEAALHNTTRKLYELEKNEYLSGRRDLGWELPASCDGLSMSVDQAREFVRQQAEAFAAENTEYFPSDKNREVIFEYLFRHDIAIPTADAIKLAWERLRRFGLIEDRPAPAPEPQTAPAVEQPQEPTEPEPQPSSEDLIGWDEATGQQRVFSRREVDLMSSEQFRRIFKLCVTRDGDRRPKFSRSRYQ